MKTITFANGPEAEAVLPVVIEGFNTNALARAAITLLQALAEEEGAGSDVADIADGCVAMLRSTFPRQDEPVSPNDLLYLAGAACAAALDTGSAAAGSLRLQLTTKNPDLYLVALELRSASESIR